MPNEKLMDSTVAAAEGACAENAQVEGAANAAAPDAPAAEKVNLAPEIDMTATAIATQKLDSVERPGWLKVVAPAKVNLFLGIGARRDDGYHEATSVMHALNLHDLVYIRREEAALGAGLRVEATLEGRAGLVVPEIPSEQNIAHKAVVALAQKIGRAEDETVTVRIVKSIPHEAGLGGGSADAAAALVGAASLWGIDPYGAQVEEAARSLGADVAFFLRGGCGCYEGAGERFARALTPAKTSVVLVKPQGGVSTGEAYRVFDQGNFVADPAAFDALLQAERADDVSLLNNLAAASEAIMPELAEVRTWLAAQDGVAGVQDVLLCGSGSCTFALCASFSDAMRIVAEAQKRGWWSRATSLGSIRAAVVS